MTLYLPRNGKPSVKNCKGCPHMGLKFVFTNHADYFGIFKNVCLPVDKIPGNLAECPLTHCHGCGFAKTCSRDPVDCGYGIPGVILTVGGP